MKRKLLLLHGALGSMDQFRDLSYLLEGQFEVHTFNFTGHGGVEGDDPFSIELFVSDTKKYLEENSLTSIDIFGYSMGGYVALQLAKENASLVNRIITLGTKFNWSPESAAKEIKMLDPEVVSVKVPAFATSLEQRHAPADWKMVMRKTAEMMNNLASGKALTSDDLVKVNAEVVICCGADDNMVTQEESKQAAQDLKNGKFLCITNFKHPIEAVDTAELAKIIQAYF